MTFYDVFEATHPESLLVHFVSTRSPRPPFIRLASFTRRDSSLWRSHGCSHLYSLEAALLALANRLGGDRQYLQRPQFKCGTLRCFGWRPHHAVRHPDDSLPSAGCENERYSNSEALPTRCPVYSSKRPVCRSRGPCERKRAAQHLSRCQRLPSARVGRCGMELVLDES